MHYILMLQVIKSVFFPIQRFYFTKRFFQPRTETFLNFPLFQYQNFLKSFSAKFRVPLFWSCIAMKCEKMTGTPEMMTNLSK